ncbi:hypothetical protein PTI98_004164 [Pleurotus ostreatus]|nr:hypothetical protein PTI98_004164 [Pleurotus ostreatus]
MEAGYWEYGATSSCMKIKEGTIALDTSDRFDEQNILQPSKQPHSYSEWIYPEASPFSTVYFLALPSGN